MRMHPHLYISSEPLAPGSDVESGHGLARRVACTLAEEDRPTSAQSMQSRCGCLARIACFNSMTCHQNFKFVRRTPKPHSASWSFARGAARSTTPMKLPMVAEWRRRYGRHSECRAQNEWLMPKSMPVVPYPPVGDPIPPESTAVRAGFGWIEQTPLVLLLILATSAYR